MNATIRIQQIILIQLFSGLKFQRFTAITELSICLEYIGNSASKIPIKSTVPNNTSHILWIFNLFSFSAIDIKASADRSSSIEMEKKPAIACLYYCSCVILLWCNTDWSHSHNGNTSAIISCYYSFHEHILSNQLYVF